MKERIGKSTGAVAVLFFVEISRNLTGGSGVNHGK
jgi:hypothetical protein